MVTKFEKGKTYRSLCNMPGSRSKGDLCTAVDKTTSDKLYYDNITKRNYSTRSSSDKDSWELVNENDNYEIY